MITEGMDGKCVNCRFYEERMNECRRYAPRAVPRMMLALCLAVVGMGSPTSDAAQMLGVSGENPMWPEVKETDWCGEYELRDG